MFVLCVMVSYPLQFFVPMERVEKYITRKCPQEKQISYIYTARFGTVLATCAIAELIPHLALFISLIGAIACTSLALVFPPIIDLLVCAQFNSDPFVALLLANHGSFQVCYARRRLTAFVILRNTVILLFAAVGFVTGTYSSLSDIIQAFGS